MVFEILDGKYVFSKYFLKENIFLLTLTKVYLAYYINYEQWSR